MPPMISRASLVLLLLASACGQTLPPRSPCEQAPQAPANEAARTQEAEIAIRQIFARQAEDWNRHDAKAWVAAFSDDAEFINILGTTLQGRAEIERRHAEIFSSIIARSRVVVTTRK